MLTPDTGIAQQLGPQLQAVLDQQLQAGGIPGVGASIAFPDGSIWSSGSGDARIAPQEAATGDTPFVVGSISKTFVTGTIMELADEGKLSVDDPLATYLPDYPNAQNITLRELLHHTSGIFDYFDAPNYDALVFGSMIGHSWTPQEILTTFAQAPYFPPGSAYHYSNTNFILLGMIIEQITGQQLGDVFRQRFFAPLGLDNTYFEGSGPPPSTAAAGYIERAKGLREQTDGTDYRPTISGATVAWAAGAIDGSARDLTVWGDALYGGHLVQPEDLAQMEDWTYYPPPIDETYGLGTRSRVIEGERVFGHTGSIRGFDAAMWHFPNTDMTITVLTNLGHIDANPIVDALAAVAYPAANGAGAAGPASRLSLAQVSQVASPTTTMAEASSARLQQILDQRRVGMNIPGLGAAIIFPDGSVWKAASGRAQIGPDELATPRTPFVVASITKTFMTAAIMQLADEGKLSIDDPLSNWLPDYPRAGQITLRELLNHTSGVFNYLQDSSFNRLVFKNGQGHYWTPQEILDTFAGAPYFAPGQGFHYTNTGFILLGLVIEQVTGMSVGDVLQQRFFTPLGLHNTYFQGNGPLPATAAQGYGFKSGTWNEWSDGTNYRPGVSGATVSWTAGAIASSASDLARWCAALYGGHVVSANSLAQMEDYTYSPYTKGKYGLGTWTRVHNGVRMFGHTGSFHGFDASMWYYPGSGVSIVTLTNRANISVNPITDALAAVALPAAQGRGSGATATLAQSTPSASGAAAEAHSLAVSDSAQLQAILDRQRTTLNIPGAAAAVIFPDGSIWKAGSGRSALSPDALASPTVPFVLGSITKTFVTAAIMQLTDEGQLSLDDPLANWLPDFPNADQITLRELLGHASGVYDYFEYPTYNKRVFKTDKTHYWTPQEILDDFVGDPYCDPGTCFHYSNTGFILLGLVVEQVTGLPLGTVLKQRFFRPLGLRHTYFQGTAAPPSTSAQGYLYGKGAWHEWSDASGYRPTISAASVAWSAGGIVSSSRDVAKWCAALYGGHVVSAHDLAEMEDYTYAPGSNGSYGLGTWSRVKDGVRMFGHTGSLRGFDAAMWFYPGTGLTVVVLTNLGRINVNPITDALAAAALPAARAYRHRLN